MQISTKSSKSSELGLYKSPVHQKKNFLRGTKFISVYNFPAQLHPSFGNQRILNFECQKIYSYLVIFSHFRSLSTRKSAFVNDFLVRFR